MHDPATLTLLIASRLLNAQVKWQSHSQSDTLEGQNKPVNSDLQSP